MYNEYKEKHKKFKKGKQENLFMEHKLDNKKCNFALEITLCQTKISQNQYNGSNYTRFIKKRVIRCRSDLFVFLTLLRKTKKKRL
jgi:hypothetical protein